MAWEAAEGLCHWQECGGKSHRDVAARSFMVTGDMIVVMGDYGTHSFAYKEDFVQVGDKNLPIRWTAPELIKPSTESTSKGPHHQLTLMNSFLNYIPFFSFIIFRFIVNVHLVLFIDQVG